MNFADQGDAQAKQHIDISSQERVEYWASQLACSTIDLLDAVRQIGTNYNMVDTFLQLNRKKNER